MSIRHHPTPETLMAYASGTLPPALAGLVACHLAVCDECAEQMRRLELLGGLLLEETEPSHSDIASSRETLQRAIERDPSSLFQDRDDDPRTRGETILPPPLARYLGMSIDEIPWKRLPKGVYQYWVKLPKRAGLMRLLKVPPPLGLLAHSHYGLEMTMVLKGAYKDKTGEYHRGDVAEMDETVEHRPKAIGDEDCICIVASEAPPRYRDWRVRMLRPILGF